MKYILVLGLSMLATDALAAFSDGNRLNDWCPNSSLISGYVGGVLDKKDTDITQAYDIETRMGGKNSSPGAAAGVVAFSLFGKACVPKNVILKQYIDVTCKYLAAYPEKRQLDGPVLVQMAMEDAWPCK